MPVRGHVDPNPVMAWFPSFEKAFEFLRQATSKSGFTVTQCGGGSYLPISIKGHGERNSGRVNFGCSKGRKPTPGTVTKMTGCPFRAHITYFYHYLHRGVVDPDNPWGVIVRSWKHNHGLESFVLEKAVQELSQKSAGDIANDIRKQFGVKLTATDVEGVQKRFLETPLGLCPGAAQLPSTSQPPVALTGALELDMDPRMAAFIDAMSREFDPLPPEFIDPISSGSSNSPKFLDPLPSDFFDLLSSEFQPVTPELFIQDLPPDFQPIPLEFIQDLPPDFQPIPSGLLLPDLHASASELHHLSPDFEAFPIELQHLSSDFQAFPVESQSLPGPEYFTTGSQSLSSGPQPQPSEFESFPLEFQVLPSQYQTPQHSQQFYSEMWYGHGEVSPLASQC